MSKQKKDYAEMELNKPPEDYTNLWNDLPKYERERLMPYMIENQILIVWQEKQKAVAAHGAHMRRVDEHLRMLKKDLEELTE